jgi:hypothetical protein
LHLLNELEEQFDIGDGVVGVLLKQPDKRDHLLVVNIHRVAHLGRERVSIFWLPG